MTSPEEARTTLRVLYVMNSLGTGGAERSLVELAPPLADLGVELTVALLGDRTEGVLHEVELPFDVHRVPDGRLPARVRALQDLAESTRPDVVHTTLFDADLLGRALRTRCRTPLLCSLVNTTYEPNRWRHDASLSVYRVRLAQALDAATSPFVDHFHAITNGVATSATRHLRIPPERITVVHRGRSRARLGEASPERQLRVREALAVGDDPMILAVGRHEAQKGFPVLLGAMPAVLASCPQARLMIAGRRGNTTAAIEQRLAELGLEDSVVLLGHRTDVPDLLAAADVLAFPSIYEGLGGAVLEAMALRCPIVASDLDTLREVAGEGGALFVPVGAAGPLAAALVRVLSDEGLREATTAVAHDRFESNFTLERAAAGMAELYREVADRRENLVRRTVRHRLVRSPVQRLARQAARSRIAVLAYHDVPHRGQFERHLDYLQDQMSALSADQLIEVINNGKDVPDHAAFITFDDGHASVVDHAVPALRERDLPAAMFVLAGLVGSDEPYWWVTVEAALRAGAEPPVGLPAEPGAAVRALKQAPDDERRQVVAGLAAQHPSTQRNLSVSDLRELEASAIAVGCHSMTHPMLDRCTAPVLADEVQRSTETLTTWLGHHPRLFAYPNGDHDARVREEVRRAGYELAFGFDHRLVHPDRADPMRLSRVRIDARDSVDRLRLVTSGLEPVLSRASRRVR